MKKLFSVLCLSMAILMLSSYLLSICASASYFPQTQILPSELTKGKENFTQVGSTITLVSNPNYRYTMYRGDKLHDTGAVVYTTNIQDYYPSRGKNATITLSKDQSQTYSVSEQVTASLGVSAGASYCGCDATVSVEVSTALGVESSIGQGYSETVSYTLTPSQNKKGGYYIAVNALVRKYRFVEEKYIPEQYHYERQWYTLFIWNKKIVDAPAHWEESKVVYETYYIENYYYTLEYVK